LQKFLILFILFISLLCWPLYGWLAYELLGSPFNTIAVIVIITAELVLASFTLTSLRQLKGTVNKNVFMIFFIVLSILITGYFFSLMVYFVL
jgi:hypothetical protein